MKIFQPKFKAVSLSLNHPPKSNRRPFFLAEAGFLAAAGLPLVLPGTVFAQDGKDSDGKDSDAKKTIEKTVADYEKIDGLFQLYQDPENGDLYMEINENQLGEEFIAFTYTENGVVEAGNFKGAYGATQILEPRRYFDKIEFVEKSTNFYFDPDSPLARANTANISDSIIASIDIKATTDGDEGEEGTGDDVPTRYLIKANSLFLSEALQQLKPSPNPDRPPNAFSLGDLSASQSKFTEIRNYPANTDVIVDYIFNNKYPTNGGGDAITDARSITIKMQHSFIAMPDAGYEPRFDDYRIGYFFDRVTDLTSDQVVNYRDLIHRWRLVKKDPDSTLSEPVKPITWWIENTTPLEYRDTIRDAVLAWNSAFEKAGFKNAMEVKVQPDDADWDAGDIRYNVLRWTSSPRAPFGGYGPSFSNPRTGELLGADIMLEYSFLTGSRRTAEVFDLAALQQSLSPAAIKAGFDDNKVYCSVGHQLSMETSFAHTALTVQGNDEAARNELVKQSTYFLLLHEVGHTLGLYHNMKASIMHGPKEVHDVNITKGTPVGSVMDYPAVNMAPVGTSQGDYYIQRPGPYDEWAIEFGYKPGLNKESRKTLLARAGEKGLAFGNDADDMRSPGGGIDPRINIFDLSSDPVAYAIDRIELVKATLPKLLDKYNEEDSWQELLQAYLSTTGQKDRMAGVIARQIGGVYVERQYPDQQKAGVEGAKQPYTPVPRETQKAALRALDQHFYDANAFKIPQELAVRLQPQRRGSNFGGTTEDPKIHERALAVQMGTLAHILHPTVLNRMVNSSLYGGGYEPAELMQDLNIAIFGNDLKSNPNAFRRNLQIAYLGRLIEIVYNPDYSSSANGAALAAIENIKSRFGLFDFNLSPTTKAHRLQVKRMIQGF